MAGKRKQKVTPRALLEIKMPGDVQIAPDSFRIAYSVQEIDWDDNRAFQHLYVTTAAEDAVPRQVTRGKDSETAPRWSPDGKWLAFLSTRGAEDADDYDDEDPKQQIWLLPMDGGGEADKLSDAPEGVGDFDWLPDASGIIYLAREPRRKSLQSAYDDRQDRKDDAVVEREEKFRQQLWRIGVEDKKAKLVHAGDYGIAEIAVSPDGKSVAFVTNYTGEVNDYHRSDVWVVDIDHGQTRQLTNGAGGKYHPAWKPDGSALLFARALNPELSFSQLNLFSVPSEGGEIVNETQDFPYDLSGWHPFWQDSAGIVYLSVALGTTTAIFRRQQGAFQPVIENDEHIHEFHVAPNGGIAVIAASLTEAPEVFWLAPGAAESQALTDLNQDWHGKYALASAEPVSWRSADGLEIEGLLTYPSGHDPDQTYPLVLALHGGPYGRAVQDLSPYSTAQTYAAEGYAVLEPNYRGSEGYGDAFSTAIQKDLGGGDFLDVIAGVDWLIAEGVADPARLGVSGSSYGGYLVNWIIGQTPRFKAAISKFGIFSLVTDFSNSQAPRWELEYLAAFPWDNPQLYAERSPASYVKNIQTPVLILHGESDPNTFIANSQEMYTALRLLGKPVQYVHYPREGHGFSEPEHRLDEMRRCLAWFDRHLGGVDSSLTHRVGDKLVRNGWELTVVSASLTTYAGRAEENGRRYVEAAFVIRDLEERGLPWTLGPADAALSRGVLASARSGRPVGLPIDVLGEKVLAEGTGWRFAFAPGKEERGLAVPLALAFRIGKAGGTYALALKDFPPITLELPAADGKEEG